ncbi:FAD-dependent oxidoreductase [Streptomyces sp. NPDC002734]|uniref:FAD-dependent oxidoreductase n=1 Tax=Streptomyces sp. NPDC002734 TaxID=3154426 RepID=UPI00332C93D0
MPRTVTVVGGGLAGLTAAIAAAERGADVTLHEAHHDLGGRARTTAGPYRTNDGPHAFLSLSPQWRWLNDRGLIGPVAPTPLRELTRLRFRRDGVLRRTPPFGMARLLRFDPEDVPADVDFLSWASWQVGEEAARATAYATVTILFHHDPGSLSARFVQERLRRMTHVPPEVRYPRGGWQSFIARMAARVRNLGVRVESGSRVTDLADARPDRGPVIVATALPAARALLDDPSLTWPGGRTVLVDLALREDPRDAFALVDLDGPGYMERFSGTDPTLAPEGEQLLQAQFPLAPGEPREDALARGGTLLDLGLPDWRERITYRREALAEGRTGAVDPPGTTWRDRPAVDRGSGVFLAGDQVAAPGVLSAVAFSSALTAVGLALGPYRAVPGFRPPAPRAAVSSRAR